MANTGETVKDATGKTLLTGPGTVQLQQPNLASGGSDLFVPAVAVIGVLLSNRPTGSTEVEFWIPPNSSITFIFKSTGYVPAAAPANEVGFSTTTDARRERVTVSVGQSIFATAMTGTVLARWI